MAIKSKTKKTNLNAVSPILQKMMTDNGYDNLQNNQREEWHKLDGLYHDIGMALVTIGHQVNEAVTQINVHGLNNVQEIVVNVNGIRRDIESFTGKLLQVKAKHADKAGEVTDEDYALCIECFNDYVLINDEFRSLIFPPLLVITEALMEKARVLKTTPDETVLDVNVVTDVQVKETV